MLTDLVTFLRSIEASNTSNPEGSEVHPPGEEQAGGLRETLTYAELVDRFRCRELTGRAHVLRYDTPAAMTSLPQLL